MPLVAPAPPPIETHDQLQERLLRCPKVHASVRKVARSKGVPSHALDDVLQDTLLRASKATFPIVADGEARKYINGIAKFAAIDFLRARNDDPEALEDLGPNEPAQAADPVEERSLTDALLTKGRQVFADKFDWFLRSKVHDETAVDIARSAGVTPGHVRDELSLMTRFLRDYGRASGIGMVLLLIGIAYFAVPRVVPHDNSDMPAYAAHGDPSLVPLDAAALRARARRELGAEQWEACTRDLEAALTLDPDGERDEVLRMYAAASSHVVRVDAESDGPQLKDRPR